MMAAATDFATAINKLARNATRTVSRLAVNPLRLALGHCCRRHVPTMITLRTYRGPQSDSHC